MGIAAFITKLKHLGSEIAFPLLLVLAALSVLKCTTIRSLSMSLTFKCARSAHRNPWLGDTARHADAGSHAGCKPPGPDGSVTE